MPWVITPIAFTRRTAKYVPTPRRVLERLHLERARRAKRQQEADERRRRHYVDQVEDIFAEGKPITDEDYENNLDTWEGDRFLLMVVPRSFVVSLARIDRLSRRRDVKSRARVTLRTRRTRRLDGFNYGLKLP
ncbi:unnamed protein product [Trichogramma brassicae]|uniref:Uncharacterized protein n=1 Tax=Trichogramma brassicae TaxID=86971 RepID=A0A6H5IW29_9HYME|nr:unnamed protein product [Trichogramma brassicae]